MNGTSRLFIAASIAGLIAFSAILGFYADYILGSLERYPNPSYTEVSSAAGDRVAAREKVVCRQFDNGRDIELCAQWDSTKLAWWGFWSGLAGAFLLFLNLIYSAKAVRAAEKGATNANEALEHARAVSRLELRPWLSIEARLVGAEWQENNFILYWIELQLTNSGRTPAINVHSWASADLNKMDPPKSWFDWCAHHVALPEYRGGDIVMPQQTVLRTTVAHLWAPQIADASGHASTHRGIAVSVTYRTQDDLGIHQTAQHYVINGLISPDFDVENTPSGPLSLAGLKFTTGWGRAT